VVVKFDADAVIGSTGKKLGKSEAEKEVVG
jgi:hypothetical protein